MAKKRVKKPDSKRAKPRRWTNYLWLILPIIVLAIATWVIFYYYIYPYSARFNKNMKPSAQTPQAKSVTPQTAKLNIEPSSQKAIAGDEASSGMILRVFLTDNSGQKLNADGDTIATLSSSSLGGEFVGGERVLISEGNFQASVRYTDRRAGNATISAFISGLPIAKTDVLITPSTPAGISKILINGEQKTVVGVGQEVSLSAALVDKYGNEIASLPIRWSRTTQEGSSEASSATSGRSIYNVIFDGPAGRSEVVRASYGEFHQDIVITIVP